LERDVIIPEDPTAVLDYTVDWTSWLAAGETISASTWVVATGMTQTTPSASIAGGKTTVWLTGGTAGQSYVVANHITTSQGRQDQRTFTVYVEAR
jgi:TRAP-type uncharacterized transport system substrate-binding protein